MESGRHNFSLDFLQTPKSTYTNFAEDENATQDINCVNKFMLPNVQNVCLSIYTSSSFDHMLPHTGL